MEDKKDSAGRPRIHNREQIALDLIEWAKKDDSINVNKFCAHYDPPFASKKLSYWSKLDEDFKEAYEIAKTFLAYRREEWLSSELLHVKAYDLNAAAYDYLIKEDRQEQAIFESSLRKEEVVKSSQEDVQRLDTLMSRLQSLQESSRNNANISKSAEQKS